jgi:hypothetical protein
MKRRAHYFRPGTAVHDNGRPVAEQARKRRAMFARTIAIDQFGQRRGDRFGNAASVSRLRFQNQHETFHDWKQP